MDSLTTYRACLVLVLFHSFLVSISAQRYSLSSYHRHAVLKSSLSCRDAPSSALVPDVFASDPKNSNLPYPHNTRPRFPTPPVVTMTTMQSKFILKIEDNRLLTGRMVAFTFSQYWKQGPATQYP
jgi:hypothetical protein